MRYFRTRTRSRRYLLVSVVIAGAALAAGGYGYSALSATSNVYTGCLKAGQISSVQIGGAPLAPCAKGAVQIGWSQTGPPGANGTSVTSSTLKSGDTNCPLGGSSFTSVSGTTYACNGNTGETGPPGPGANVFASDGTYSVPPGAKFIEVEVWGAGGGGGAAFQDIPGVGGGGGATVLGLLAVSSCSLVDVSVGSGGVGATGDTGAGGSEGGSSSVSCGGSSLTAGGGEGGPGNVIVGPGGTASFSGSAVALTNDPGQSGHQGVIAGGAGGNNGGGSGGAAALSDLGPPSDGGAGGIGGGGGGAGPSSDLYGGPGGDGLVIIFPIT